MKKKNYIGKTIKIGIILIIVAILVIVAYNAYSPNFQVEVLGLSMVVPEGSFNSDNHEYEVYSIYDDKKHNWSISAINPIKTNWSNIKDSGYVGIFYNNKPFSSVLKQNYSVEGISLFKLDKSNSKNSYINLSDIEFRILDDNDTVLSFFKSIRNLTDNKFNVSR